MSRLTKKSIMIPQGATLTKQGDNFLVVKGPKGELTLGVPKSVVLELAPTELWVKDAPDMAIDPLTGTFWALAKNAMEGVTEGFSKVLEIEGVGYRAQMDGKQLVLFLGYAQPVKVDIAQGVTVAVDKNVIKVSGIDKELVGRVAAEIRALKKPEPYKGKGIHYQGEVIRRKVGKKAGATAA